MDWVFTLGLDDWRGVLVNVYFCFLGKLPIPWNLSEYSFARSSMFSIFLVSFVVILQLICTGSNCMEGLCPKMAVSFSHIV